MGLDAEMGWVKDRLAACAAGLEGVVEGWGILAMVMVMVMVEERDG